MCFIELWLQVVHQWGCNFESDISSYNRIWIFNSQTAAGDGAQKSFRLRSKIFKVSLCYSSLFCQSFNIWPGYTSSSSPHCNCPIISVRKAKPPINAYFLAPVRLSSPTVVWNYTNIQILWYYKYYAYDDDSYTNMSVTQISSHQFIWPNRSVLCALCAFIYYVL